MRLIKFSLLRNMHGMYAQAHLINVKINHQYCFEIVQILDHKMQ